MFVLVGYVLFLEVAVKITVTPSTVRCAVGV